MTDSMVERVSERILFELEARDMESASYLAPILARAAIEAMREPTGAMIDAAPEGDIVTEDYLRDAWAAMIDAALKE